MCCVVCVIEYGWYVGRGDCGVCGWKDRCRDGNLRTYCHVSPILFGWFFVEASPTCFCIFVTVGDDNTALGMPFQMVQLCLNLFRWVIHRQDCILYLERRRVSLFAVTDAQAMATSVPVAL